MGTAGVSWAWAHEFKPHLLKKKVSILDSPGGDRSPEVGQSMERTPEQPREWTPEAPHTRRGCTAPGGKTGHHELPFAASRGGPTLRQTILKPLPATGIASHHQRSEIFYCFILFFIYSHHQRYFKWHQPSVWTIQQITQTLCLCGKEREKKTKNCKALNKLAQQETSQVWTAFTKTKKIIRR